MTAFCSSIAIFGVAFAVYQTLKIDKLMNARSYDKVKHAEGEQGSWTGNVFATDECFVDAPKSADVGREKLTF